MLLLLLLYLYHHLFQKGLRIGDCEQADTGTDVLNTYNSYYISTLGNKLMFHICAGSGQKGCYDPVKVHEVQLGGSSSSSKLTWTSISSSHSLYNTEVDVPFTITTDSAYDSSGLLMVEISGCWEDLDAGNSTTAPTAAPPLDCEGLVQFRIRPLMGITSMWDINQIIFEDSDGNPIGTFDEFSSGWYNYPEPNGYSTGSAFTASGVWGGRSDANGNFYIGAFTAGSQVPAALVLQQQVNNFASAIVIEGAASTAEPGSLGDEWVEIYRMDAFDNLALPLSRTEIPSCAAAAQQQTRARAEADIAFRQENPCTAPAAPSFIGHECNSAVCAFVYTGISGSSISNLISDSSFPDSPDETIEVGASGTNTQLKFPESGTNYGNLYGLMMMGYLKVPMNGAYTFDVYSDDSSAVYIEVEPGTWTEVVALNGCCVKREGTTLVSLKANQLYLVKILFKEGGGNDYVQVGFKRVAKRVCSDFPASLTSFATPEEVLAPARCRWAIERPVSCRLYKTLCTRNALE